MKEDNKKIAKNTVILYARMIFVMFVSLFTSRIILNRLGVTDFGIFNVIGGLVAILGFVNQALTNATQRFITFNLAKNNKCISNKIFNVSLYLHVMIGLCVVILGESVGQYFLQTEMVIPDEKMQAASFVLFFSLLSSFISISIVPFNAEIIAHESMKYFTLISVIETLVKLVFVLSLYLFDEFLLVIFSFFMFLNQLIVAFLTIVYCKKYYAEVFLKFHKDVSLFKDVISFSFWSLFGNLAWALTTHGTNVILNLFFNPSVNAARGISFQVQSAITTLANNFNMAINPQITKSYSLDNLKRVHQLLLFSSRVSFLLLLVPSIPIYLESDFVLNLWLGIVPEHTVNFVKLTLFLILIVAIENPFNTSIFATGNIKLYHIIVGCINLLNIPVLYIVFKYFKVGPELAYIVIIITTLFCQFVRLLFVKYYIKLSLTVFVKSVYIPCGIVLFVSLFATNFLREFLFFNSFINLLSEIVFTSVFVFILGLNDRERNFIIQNIKQKIFKV